MYREGRRRAGTYETKMAALNVRCSIPRILRKNRGLWTVYRFVYLNISAMRIFLLVLLNWWLLPSKLYNSQGQELLSRPKRALKIIHLKSLCRFYALCHKHQGSCKLLIVCISPMYHTSLLTMYYWRKTRFWKRRVMPLYVSVAETSYHLKKSSPRKPCILDSRPCTFRIPGTRFWIPCQWNLDCGYQSFAGFRIPWAELRIPKPRIPDSTSNIFSKFRNQIT